MISNILYYSIFLLINQLFIFENFIKKNNFKILNLYIIILFLFDFKWGLGIGPNPQSPIPNSNLKCKNNK